MNRHTLRVLEFEKIRTAVRERCLTDEGQLRLKKERLATDSAVVAVLQRQVAAVRVCLETVVQFPGTSFPPVADSLATVKREGAVLEAEELAAIGSYCRSAGSLQSYLRTAVKESERTAEAFELAEAIPEVAAIAKEIGRYLEPDGTVREKEIPELRAIRSRINRAQQELQRSAMSLLKREDMQRYWNATVPTQREGRTVLPLKVDHKSKVKGIVHEVSATGATVFIEPDELVQRNNECVEADNAYRAELLRILRELSSFCRGHHALLEECVAKITEVDLVYARARYGLDFDCHPPSPGATLALVGARHPLLGEMAVPINVTVPEGKRVLIITGPNTGGKTVALKTIGLLSLMNQFGLPIPALPGSELPIFTGIYADIGDEQSIEQSLSTFSGHMRNIARILNGADQESLVLLDELGSGTDPEEGGALAMAVLDELLELGPYTVVTTHHGQLKHYGFTQEAAANASVEFDPKSLRPTYHIVPGVPGSSHAIEVAAHMGLLRKVTRQAREYLSGDEYDTGQIIRTLTDREQEIRREIKRVRQLERGLQKETERLDEREDALDDRESELRKAKLRDLEQFAAEARSSLENLVRELREGEITREKTQKVKGFIEELGERLAAERETGPGSRAGSDRRRDTGSRAARTMAGDAGGPAAGSHADHASPTLPAKGATVRIRSTGKEGTIVRAGKKGTWIVQVRAMKFPVPEDDLELLSLASERSNDRPDVHASVAASTHAVPILDIRGARMDEAIDIVERQIDSALLSGMYRFSIIHGTGEGVLQTAVRNLLKQHPHVSRFGYASPEEGGYGKTEVELT